MSNSPPLFPDHQELTPGGFSALLDAAADGIVIIDQKGGILNFNQAAERLFGYRSSHVVGQNVKMLMPDPYKQEHDGYLKQYTKTGIPKIIGIGRRVEGRRKDGSVFPIELSVGEYREGETLYFVGIIRDLTYRESVETALRKSQQRLREREQALNVTLSNAPIGIMTLDLEGRILSANHAACALTGHSEEELMQVQCSALLDPEGLTLTEQHRQEMLAEKVSTFTQNCHFTRKDGQNIYVVLHCALVPGPDQRPDRFVVQLVDQTEKINAERDAGEARERLAHVDRISTMGEMATGIAHELNQPLTAISSYVQACSRRLEADNLESEKLRELLQKITDQSLRAGTIIQRIRSLTQSQDRFRERIDAKQLVADTLVLARADTNSRGIPLKQQELAQPCEIIADGVQIQQVILNLIRNAIDATESAMAENRGIVIKSEITPAKDYVEISVRDFGRGVSEDIRDRLFEPFVTLKKSGTGLGLSISRSIVDAHGGDIWAEHLAQGTRFCFILPVAVGEK